MADPCDSTSGEWALGNRRLRHGGCTPPRRPFRRHHHRRLARLRPRRGAIKSSIPSVTTETGKFSPGDVSVLRLGPVGSVAGKRAFFGVGGLEFSPLSPSTAVGTIPCLLYFGIGSIRLLFVVAEFSPVSTVFLTVLSAVLCIILALALGCRRWVGTSYPKSWAIAAMIVLPPAMWVDFRFRIIAVDALGSPVATDITFNPGMKKR